jgi:hypothetical protein
VSSAHVKRTTTGDVVIKHGSPIGMVPIFLGLYNIDDICEYTSKENILI